MVEKTQEERIRDIEEFVNEIKGGRKWVLSFFVAVGGVVATVYYLISGWRLWHG